MVAMPVVRRLAVAVLAAATLIAAPVAAAKDIQSSRVCGPDGCTDTGALGAGGFALIPPGVDLPPLSPWYRIRLAMGDGDRVLQRFKVLWAPRIHMIAVDERSPRWMPASRRTERIARRITRGVTPFPAATMPVTLPPPGKVEVIGPVATPRAEGDGAGVPPWLVIPLVGALAAAAALGYRSRRAKAHTASAPTMPT
jgi:hypothetical protein